MNSQTRMTLGDLLDQGAERFPDQPALVDVPGGRSFTYGQFQQMANQAAKGLMALGLAKGAHLALWAPNLIEWIVAQVALAKAGLVLTTVDTSYQAEQVRYQLEQSGSQGLIMAPGVADQEFLAMLGELCPELAQASQGRLECAALPELKRVVLLSGQAGPGLLDWQGLLALGQQVSDQELDRRQASVDPDDVLSLLYTSGTTGAPKGVMSTHRSTIGISQLSAQNMGLSQDDRLCLAVPLHHMFGSICVVVTGLTKGATLVVPGPVFEPGQVLAAVAKARCTAIFGSPNMFLAMMEHPLYAELDLSSLRTGIMGGASCPLEVMKQVVDEMGVRDILVGYGQTEASSWATQTRPDDPLELRVSTVGRALPGVQVKIVNPVSGQEEPPDKVGEFCVRGMNMKGYYNMPAATASAIDPEGWLHTGDMATMDQQGYVRIAGRLKEVITHAGQPIYPIEVEEVLFSHPKVANAQVFGVPSPDGGEDLAAWIKLEEGQEATVEELRQFCQEHLAGSHVPAYIKFVREFPLTAVGKVQKFKISQAYAKELGLS